MSDYNFLMESRLSASQLQVVNYLSRLAYAEGVNLYLVGGAVRDLTYGLQEIRDLDFAVEGDPERILRHLRKSPSANPARLRPETSAGRTDVPIEQLRYHRRLGACAVIFSGGIQAEVARCRREIYARPNRPPQIEPGTIFDDLRRRDFAANAMAISLHPNSRGLLLDPVNGAGDIERRELRSLYSRSFADDPSKIYRLFRLGLRLGFKPEEKTRRWLDAALEGRPWTHLDAEAQGRELAAILREENPARTLRLFAERGLLAGLDRKFSRIDYERFHRIRGLAQKLPDADVFLLNFHCLVVKLSPSQRRRLAAKIIVYPEAARLAVGLERIARKFARQLSSSKGALPSRAYKLLAAAPQPALLFLLAYYPQAKVRNRLKTFLFKAPQIRARLPRAELEALGIKPGPKFEKILERIFFAQLDGKIRTPQQLLRALRSLAGVKEPPKPPRTKPQKMEKGPAKGDKALAAAKQAPRARPDIAPSKLARKPEKPPKPQARKQVLRKGKKKTRR